MKKYFIIVPLLFLAAACSSPKQAEVKTSPVFDQTEIINLAYKAVDSATKGVWDKKIIVSKVDDSKMAVKGKWVAQDYWDWIAFKQGSDWKVLVSLDGFDCDQVKTIPQQFNSFFHDSLYLNDVLQCYDFSKKNN